MARRAGGAVRHNLHVTLFGNLRLAVDGQALRIGVRPMVASLLAQLVLSAGRPIPRDDLSFLIWPDDTEEAARANLRRHLHYLREALPPSDVPWVEVAADGVYWNPAAPSTADVIEFARLIERRESRAEAVELYGGDLLASLDYDWVIEPRERLRAQYINALWELSTDARLRRDAASAAVFLQRLLVADPWREDAIRELMLARHESGDRAGALKTCLDFERLLEIEMGATLMPQTAALRAAIAAGEPLPKPAVPHNLPSPASSFIGRRDELSEIERRLAESRLVTLVGEGGVGKTRAALTVAAEHRERFEDGAWLVDLAMIDDASLVASTIARTLGVSDAGNDALDALTRYLAKRSLVIVLDNCEHVIHEAARVATTILSGAPNVRILATSRQRLGLGAESIYRLPSLAVPERGARLSAAEAMRFDGVALFAARARSVSGGFALTDENAAPVSEICRRLDGIPLAIELAAARANALSPTELARMLDERFRILVGGERTALERHRTMRALIDWSYGLLTQPEQRLFERLSIFVGGCTLDSAGAVCSGDGLDETNVLDLLSSLVDKSLVVADSTQPVTRYTLLESFREYGREKIEQRGESLRLALRHAETYLALAERLQRSASSLDQGWVAAIDRERANWIAVLAWTLGAGNELALGRRLLLTQPVWMNWDAQPRRWLRLALDSLDDATPPHIAGGLLLKESATLTELGEFEEGARVAQRAVAVYRAAGQLGAMSSALHISGAALVFHGRLAEGAELLEEAIAASRAAGNHSTLAYALLSLGHARSATWDLAGQRALIDEAQRVFDEMPATVPRDFSLMAVRSSQAEHAFASGDAEGALEYISEALAILRPSRHRSLAGTLSEAATYLIALNRFDEARERAREGLVFLREMPAEVIATMLLQNLAAIAALRAGQDAGAGEDLSRAARLMGFVDARLHQRSTHHWHAERQEWERVHAVLRETVDDARRAKLTSDGERMTSGQAIELAESI